MTGARSEAPELPAVFPALASAAFLPLRYRAGRQRTWSGHLPFARDLVASLRPRLLVELGTHYGESYFGFCQSIVETGCDCTCYAVDTWVGDPHSLAYGREVYDDVEQHNSEQYGAFSHLLRSTFDDALAKFTEESIDLLHIDGLHTYDAVKTDFETWRCKLSDRAVVLFHDTVETQRDFGVYRLWAELSPNFPSFNFEHGHGLGILAVGSQPPPAFLDFLRTANAKPAATRGLFAALGRRVLLETEKRWLNQKSPVQRALTVLKSKSLLR